MVCTTNLRGVGAAMGGPTITYLFRPFTPCPQWFCKHNILCTTTLGGVGGWCGGGGGGGGGGNYGDGDGGDGGGGGVKVRHQHVPPKYHNAQSAFGSSSVFAMWMIRTNR